MSQAAGSSRSSFFRLTEILIFFSQSRFELLTSLQLKTTTTHEGPLRNVDIQSLSKNNYNYKFIFVV